MIASKHNARLFLFQSVDAVCIFAMSGNYFYIAETKAIIRFFQAKPTEILEMRRNCFEQKLINSIFYLSLPWPEMSAL